MSVEENVRLGNLIDIYGDLLSEKQKLAITRYVNADMSLSEIAQDENITRVYSWPHIKQIIEERMN